MFASTTFLVITTQVEEDIVQLLRDNHATVLTKEESDNTHNYLRTYGVDHIITVSTQFIEYEEALRAMIPISTPQWVYDSLSLQRHLSPKTYNPDPKFFMRDCFVCVADNLPTGDKEAIYAGVRAFGGSFLDVLTKYTTHLVAMDMTNEKSIIASSAISTQEDKIDIKIVAPNWVDHCLLLGKKVDEGPYLLSDKDRTTLDTNMASLDTALSTLNTATLSEKDMLDGIADYNVSGMAKTFYISSDLHLSERLMRSLSRMIEAAGGKVAEAYDDNVDVYIGKFRSGEAYKEACNSERVIVGNLHWLYSVLSTGKWVLPHNSNVLHYPVPDTSLADFKGLNISITNYSGDARVYLSKLITIMGGRFTKTLTRDNHYLLCARPEGKKWETATQKWVDANGNPTIQVVNHLWLEECYAKWELLSSDSPKYRFQGRDSHGVEMLLGRTKLDTQVLRKWYAPEPPGDDIDDSMSDDGSVQTASVPVVSEIAQQKARYGSRSAAKRAAEKLHDNMSDLNAFKEIAKSKTKMKSYMERLEGHEKEKEEAVKHPKTFFMVAIMTGCEDLALSKADATKLAHAGIKVLSDFSPKHSVNTLIAPRILRTEKFLRSLARVDSVVHPTYLADVLARINSGGSDIATEFKPADYALDKVQPVRELNVDLGSSSRDSALARLLASPNRGRLFASTPLNVSANVRGGHALIVGILSDHGLASYSVVKQKASVAALKKQLVRTEEGQAIFVCNKAQDGDSIRAFKNCVDAAGIDGVAIEWEWCVRSIFAMELVPFDKYKV